MTKKAVKEEQRNKTQGIQKTQSKTAHTSSINNIHINGLRKPIRRQRLDKKT